MNVFVDNLSLVFISLLFNLIKEILITLAGLIVSSARRYWGLLTKLIESIKICKILVCYELYE
jgi:hypothetical protein